MALDFDAFAILLLLAPFAGAVLAPLIVEAAGRAGGWILAIIPAGVFAALVGTLPGIAAGQANKFGLDWVPVLNLRFSFLVDGLGLTFALLISGIGAVILVYSSEYLRGHAHLGRFMSILLAFMGAMLGLVLADSFVALFAFWELTSVTSFLLIGFEAGRAPARRAAFQALVVTGLGGLALMAAGVILANAAGTWNISELLTAPGLRAANDTYPLVFALIAIAAFTKSAQLPFHFWLPNAMEAPTPVSAYLHSATMVQGGVYLLARMSPILAGSALWQGTLCTVGGATLLWAALQALGQTDLKQLLARSTVAALGLLVFLLGLGGQGAALAVAAYFVAHALYKAALFLVVGILDHGTGTRDLTVLGGLRDHLTISFIAAGLAGASMFGVPPFLGYIAKEEMYAGASLGDPFAIATIAVLVLGNALAGTAALALVIKPFMGALKPTPEAPHEGGFALWIGPIVFGLTSFAVVFAVGFFGDSILAPMASAIAGTHVTNHFTYAIDFAALPIWLSLATWGLSALFYWRLDAIRAILARVGKRFSWTWDKGFDQAMVTLIRNAGRLTRLFHHGRLELYLVMLFGAFALTILVPLWTLHAFPSLPDVGGLTFYEWAALAMAAAGVVVVVVARTRLGAILALGIQGLAVGLIFIFMGAPDLAFTQLLIEVLSVVIIALVMTRLHLGTNDPRPLEDWARDGTLAIVVGVSVTLLLLKVLETPFDPRLSNFFSANSYAVAHGRNIVNVIIVDFRGLDTLGEIAVVMTAGIAILALLRRQHKREPLPHPGPPPHITPEAT